VDVGLVLTATLVPGGCNPWWEVRRALQTWATRPDPMGIVGTDDDDVVVAVVADVGE
jgi:hypothetical protein